MHEVMNEVHDKNIDIKQRVNNYHHQHYTTFLQTKFPFLYEEFEKVKSEPCTRERAKYNQQLRANN